MDEDGRSAWLRRVADRRRIAVLPLRGVIGGAVKTEDIIRRLGWLRRTARIRAVVLDIDSPGGAATASEALYVAVKQVAARKPVVAWIRGTGASGAYFAACGASRILTFPSAIVGSIGVISVRPVAVEALQRLGTRIHVTKTGAFKEWLSPGGTSSAPYGIAIAPDGRIFYDEARSGSIVVFDRKSGQMETIKIPTRGSIVRNMSVDSTRGRIWLALSGTGRIGKIELK